MELNSLIFLAIGLVAGILLGGYFQFKPFSPSELSKLGEIAALAAEQYMRDGVLVTNDQQLTFAVDFFKARLPFLQRLSTEDVVKIVKSAVPKASALTATINAAKEPPGTDMLRPAPPTIGTTGLR